MSQMQAGTTTNNIVFRIGATTSRCLQYHGRTEGASRRQSTSFAANRPLCAVHLPPASRRHSPTTTKVATFISHNCAPQVSERWIVEIACVCEVTSGREMAGRHLRNRSISFVEDSIGRGDTNEVNKIRSFINTAVILGAETEGTVTSEWKGNNSDSIFTTEVGVGMSNGRLQELQAECSNLRSDF